MENTKRMRFDALDGLRGVAAFAVLLFHLTPAGMTPLFPHSALAVDFFFMLSGFVIAGAYEERIKTGLSLARFMRVRLVRLYPLIALATLLGAMGFFFVYDSSTLAILIVTGLLMIPTPLGALSEGQPAFALNPPGWSLFWELVANLIFFSLVPYATRKRLLTLAGLSLCILGVVSYRNNGLNTGSFWYDFYNGMPRVIFAFYAGNCLFRLRAKMKQDIGGVSFLVAALLLCCIFAMPKLGSFNWLYDLAVVAIAFPTLIIVSSGLRELRYLRACHFAGALSYPIYVLQSGIIPHLNSVPTKLHASVAVAHLLSFGIALAFCCFSWVVLKLYDEPVRRWLLTRRERAAQPSAATAP